MGFVIRAVNILLYIYENFFKKKVFLYHFLDGEDNQN